jgi:hypothetical protein
MDFTNIKIGNIFKGEGSSPTNKVDLVLKSERNYVSKTQISKPPLADKRPS